MSWPPPLLPLFYRVMALWQSKPWSRSRLVFGRDGHQSKWSTVEMDIGRRGFGRSGNRSRWPINKLGRLPLTSMDSWLARFCHRPSLEGLWFCILVNACHRKSLGSHFTPVKTLDRHWLLHMHQCMKCNRWQVFSFKFHENSEKKNGKVPQIFKTLKYLLKIAKKICWC